MCLVCTMLANDRGDEVLGVLTAAGFRATRVSSTGGFMRRGNTLLLTGVEQDGLGTALTLVCIDAVALVCEAGAPTPKTLTVH